MTLVQFDKQHKNERPLGKNIIVLFLGPTHLQAVWRNSDRVGRGLGTRVKDTSTVVSRKYAPPRT